MGEEWVVARGLGQYLGYTKRGKTRRLAKRVSGGRKNDKTFTECGFSELRRGGNDQKIRAERKSALLIRKLRLARPKSDECAILGMVVKLAGSEPVKTATVQ